MSITLDQIIERSRADLAQAGLAEREAELRAEAESAPAPRDFFDAVTEWTPRDAGAWPGRVIAEVKRRSPSRGWLRRDWADESFDPGRIAQLYEAAGAGAISCLTNEPFFAGSADALRRVRAACALPVVRKEFILIPAQVYEARAMGADALLLMDACLTPAELEPLVEITLGLGMTPLIEAHDEGSFGRSLEIAERHASAKGGVLLGVNNRDLRSMRVERRRAERVMAGRVRDGVAAPHVAVVGESGLSERGDLDALWASGVRIALVGGALMEREEPGAALAAMTGAATR